jgi:hypothetical protein
MEIQSDSAIPFPDVQMARNGTALASKLYKKPTHSGRYLDFKCNHPPRVKAGQFRVYTMELLPCVKDDNTCLMKLATCDEISNSVINSKFINSTGSILPDKEESLFASVYIPYMRRISEKFRRIGNRFTLKLS